MFAPARLSAGVSRALVLCALGGGLGGCYSMGSGGDSPPTTPTTPTPAQFSSMSGTLNSKAVVTQSIGNVYTNAVTNSVETRAQPATIQTQVQALNTPSAFQRVDVSVGGYGWFGTNEGTMQSNGSAVRGTAVSSPATWAIYTNAPGSRLDASLGTPSLEHSFAGVGLLGRRAVGSTGDFASHAFGTYGGRSTTDMPTSGRADYAGSFEGFEQSGGNGQQVPSYSISGKANLSADFAARTVRGRIDDINNHSQGPRPMGANYSIGFDGRMTQSDFAGNAWLTQRNSDAPLNGFTQNSGTLQGGFFGPGAAETAGAIGVSAADANRKSLVTGAFGAKKR